MMISKNMMWGLLAVAAAAGVAAVLMPSTRNRRRTTAAREDESARVDEASEDSFPASDPPSFSAPAVSVPGPTS